MAPTGPPIFVSTSAYMHQSIECFKAIAWFELGFTMANLTFSFSLAHPVLCTILKAHAKVHTLKHCLFIFLIKSSVDYGDPSITLTLLLSEKGHLL